MQLPYFFVRFAPALPAAASIAAAPLVISSPLHMYSCVCVYRFMSTGWISIPLCSIGWAPPLLNERLDDVRWPVELIKERKREKKDVVVLDCLPSCAHACVLCLQIDLIPSVLVIYQHIISYIGGKR
jgi:hypothetical protein